VKSVIESCPWQFVRWLDEEGAAQVNSGLLHLGDNVRPGTDSDGNPVVFFPTPWAMKYFGDTHKKIALYELALKKIQQK
jgi:peptide subunit release factor RF-3